MHIIKKKWQYMAVCLFLAGFVLGCLGENLSASAFVGAAIGALLMENLDKLREFRLGQVSIIMREVKETAEETQATLSQVQKPAVELCSASLFSLTAKKFSDADFDYLNSIFIKIKSIY